MIRHGSILRFADWSHASDIRLTVVRFDRETDTYHLQSTRALHDCTMERSVLHSWVRRKALVIERTGPS